MKSKTAVNITPKTVLVNQTKLIGRGVLLREVKNSEDVTKMLGDLRLGESSEKVNEPEVQLTREEILERRKLKKQAEKEAKKRRQLEEKALALRAPKSQKIQIIDTKFLEKYKKSTNPFQLTKKTELESPTPGTSTSCETPTTNVVPIPYEKLSIKHKLKKQQFSINLNDLIVKPQSKQLRKQQVRTNLKTIKKIQRNRGKKRENKKPKILTPLKRNILQIRALRRELRTLNASEVVAETKVNVPEGELTSVVPSSPPPPVSQTPSNSIEPQSNSPTHRHSRKWRPYCNHYITPELCESVELLLKDIFRFQKRAYDKNEIKGRAKKRYVVGFKETLKFLELKKIKLLLIAPDLEPNEGPNGIDATVERMKVMAEEQEVPYCFSVRRRRIGYLLLKVVPVSCVGVINYEGSDSNYVNILSFIETERENYKKFVKN